MDEDASNNVFLDLIVDNDPEAADPKRHEWDDVREVAAGYECGVGVKDFHDFAVGDILEFFSIQEAG